MKKGLLGLVVALVACGGIVDAGDVPTGCALKRGVVPCREGVYVFHDANGSTVGDECPAVPCDRGARCAVFVGVGAEYGTCR